ncbi:glycosyltransferase 87 family protein [Propionicicella superfundia]|uniref:glycosyltransferase 87 family protein n=1 Tax=Propionicicella superfundia TaxID=348582 RepID=UPI00146A51A4|nr:glycosyltransferase 87 family protein [Propionicicella superfundia]
MPVALAAAWIASRAYLFKLVRWSTFPPGDLSYYVSALKRGTGGDLTSLLPEYPTPVAAALRGLWLVAGGDQVVFTFAFIAVMVLLDAAFAVGLWRHARPARRVAATVLWILLVPLIGSLAYLRFDLVPTVLAGAAILLVRRRPSSAGAFVGLGAAIKLTPALLVLPLLGRRADRRRVLTGFVAVGGGLALLGLAVGGWDRLVSPLGFQSGRGVQIESIAATVPMLVWAAGSSRYSLAISPHHAWEITGPLVGALGTVSSVAFAAGLVFVAWLGYRVVRHRIDDAGSVALVSLATVAVLIVTNKVLSPQYVLWLAGPLTALVALQEPTASPRPALSPFAERNLILGMLMIAVLTQVVYPVTYAHITRHTPLALRAVLVLSVRNVLLLGWAGAAAWLAIRVTRRPSGGLIPTVTVEPAATG